MITLNGHPVYTTKFPDGTQQVWKLPEIHLRQDYFNITWEYESDAEIFHLCQLVDLVRSVNTSYISLHMPYLPYGRQDKKVDNANTFALHSLANIINDMKLDYVSTIDAHSKVASKLFDRFTDIFPRIEIAHAITSSECDVLGFPDAGASTRYGDKFKLPTVVGCKTRDQQTGWITDFSIEGDCKDKKVLVIDDICDGGMTFKLMAEALYKAGASEVMLYVTHGLFTKGLDTLRDSGINKIYTKDGEE